MSATVEAVAYRFKFKHGSPYDGKQDQAQAVGEAVMVLRERVPDETTLTAALVREARDEGHPAHDFFEWEDSTAAEVYRRAQANRLLNALVMVRVSVEDEAEEVEFVSVRVEDLDEEVHTGLQDSDEEPKRQYVTTDEALADPGLRQAYLVRTVKQVASHLPHVERFEELEFLVKATRKAQRLAGLI